MTSTEVSSCQELAEWLRVFHAQGTESDKSSETFTKRLTVVAISLLTYMKNAFPENCNLEETFAGLKIKILKNNCENLLAQFLLTSLTEAFDALDKKYLHQLALCIYEGECKQENLLECHIFEYRYNSEGVTMSANTKNRNNENQSLKCTFGDVKKQTMKLLQTCIVMMQSCTQELPESADIIIHLHYNDDAPEDYQAPGYKCGSPHSSEEDHWEPTLSKAVGFGCVETPYHKIVAKSYMRDTVRDSFKADVSSNPPVVSLSPSEDNSGGPAEPSGSPQGSVSRSGSPQGSGSLSGSPQGSAGRSGSPQGSVSQSGSPQGSVSLSGSPQGSAGRSGSPQGSAGRSGSPQGCAGRSGSPQGSVSRPGSPHGSVSRSGSPQGSAGQSGSPQGSADRSGSPQGSVTRTSSELQLKCPCTASHETPLLIKCHYCNTIQHATCFGLLPEHVSGVEQHCCTSCSDENPDRTPTDALLARLSHKKRRCFCIYRRTLEWCKKLSVINGPTLVEKLGITHRNATKVLQLLNYHGIISLEPDSDATEPNNINVEQLNLQLSKCFRNNEEKEQGDHLPEETFASQENFNEITLRKNSIAVASRNPCIKNVLKIFEPPTIYRIIDEAGIEGNSLDGSHNENEVIESGSVSAGEGSSSTKREMKDDEIPDEAGIAGISLDGSHNEVIESGSVSAGEGSSSTKRKTEDGSEVQTERKKLRVGRKCKRVEK